MNVEGHSSKTVEKIKPFSCFHSKRISKGLPLEITAFDFFVCLARNMSRIGSLRRITETVGSIYGIFKTCLYLILSGGISVGLVAHKKQPRTTMPVDRIQIHARFAMCSTKLLSQFLTILFASSRRRQMHNIWVNGENLHFPYHIKSIQIGWINSEEREC